MITLGFTAKRTHPLNQPEQFATTQKLRRSGPLWTFAGPTLLAGGPAVLGMWLGSLAHAPQWSALALAIGAGAILQVIVEVGAYLMRRSQKGLDAFFTPPVIGGLAAGVAFMYATAALVKV